MQFSNIPFLTLYKSNPANFILPTLCFTSKNGHCLNVCDIIGLVPRNKHFQGKDQAFSFLWSSWYPVLLPFQLATTRSTAEWLNESDDYPSLHSSSAMQLEWILEFQNSCGQRGWHSLIKRFRSYLELNSSSFNSQMESLKWGNLIFWFLLPRLIAMSGHGIQCWPSDPPMKFPSLNEKIKALLAKNFLPFCPSFLESGGKMWCVLVAAPRR